MRRQRFPKIADTVNRVARRFVVSIIRNSDPVLGQLGEQRIYEGDVMEAAQGSDVTVSNFQTISSNFLFTQDTIRNTDFEVFVDELARGALDLYESQSRTLVDQFADLTEQTGQIVDAGGTLTWGAWLQTLEKLELFDERGDWIRPTLMIHPDDLGKWKQMFEEAAADPSKRAQLGQLFERKRREFFAKETNRYLAG